MTPTFDDVRDTVVEVLGIQDRAATLAPETPMLDHIPELDSMAVVELLSALETRFGIHIDDAEVSAELLETLGSLVDYVQSKSVGA